jgi:threonine aldolase
MKNTIDLRSDTVTLPTPAMRHAISIAPVGDDVYGEDPTTRALEIRASEELNRESALFVPTGSMGNQIAIHLHCRAGSEVIGEAGSHVFNFEMGAMAVLSGALPRPITTSNGILTPELLSAAVQPQVGYATPTSMVVLENSHNLAGGRVTPVQTMKALITAAKAHDLPVHLDGARIFNAAAALGIPAAELAKGCDTVMFCLSKGLAAPVGSMLVGDQEHITEARRIRKLFGGGMRQSGILAAAGLISLDEMVEGLAEDNRRARLLADLIAGAGPIILDPEEVETNIVFLHLSDDSPLNAKELASRLSSENILVHALGPASIRLVTHYHIDDSQIEETAQAIRKILA